MALTADDPLYGEDELSINDFQKYFRVVTEARTQEVLRSMYPALSDWVQHHGKFEIGFASEGAVSARLIGPNGVLFETTQAKTLAEALWELEVTILTSAGLINF